MTEEDDDHVRTNADEETVTIKRSTYEDMLEALRKARELLSRL